MAAAMVLLAPSRSAQAASSSRLQRQGDVERLEKAAKAIDAGDCRTAQPLAESIADSKDHPDLNDLGVALADEIAAACEVDAGARPAAYTHAMHGTALREGSDNLWRIRLAIELDDQRFDAAVLSTELMLRDHPDALNRIPTVWLGQALPHLQGAANRALRKRLLAVLSADSYRPVEPFARTDGFIYRYAAILAQDGDQAGARALVARLGSPAAVMDAMVDPRLSGLVARDTDVRALAEEDLARVRAEAKAHPKRLEGQVMIASALRSLGRSQEALAMLDDLRGKVSDPKAFEDRDQQLNWFWDVRAHALADLNRYDEAVASLREGDKLNEWGTLNVSQRINLAELQNRFGHGEDALRTLEAFNDPKRRGSPYGEAEMRFARACAHAVAGHPEQAAEDVTYLRAHEADHPEALSDALLCVGDMDAAAAAVIRRLDDPDRRAGALRQLSDYDAPPSPPPPYVLRDRLAALKQRQDVQAAITRAGGLRRFHLQAPEL